MLREKDHKLYTSVNIYSTRKGNSFHGKNFAQRKVYELKKTSYSWKWVAVNKMLSPSHDCSIRSERTWIDETFRDDKQLTLRISSLWLAHHFGGWPERGGRSRESAKMNYRFVIRSTEWMLECECVDWAEKFSSYPGSRSRKCETQVIELWWDS